MVLFLLAGENIAYSDIGKTRVRNEEASCLHMMQDAAPRCTIAHPLTVKHGEHREKSHPRLAGDKVGGGSCGMKQTEVKKYH